MRVLARLRSPVRACLAAAVVATLPALHSDAWAEQVTAAPAAVVEMTSSLKFVPHPVRVKVGDVVKWSNTSELSHTVTAMPDKASDPSHVDFPPGAEPFNSGFIRPGNSCSRRFTVPGHYRSCGHYRYFCIPHEVAGMIGDIIVKK